MTQGDLEQLAIPMQQSMSSLELRIMQDVIRRIKINGEITSTADWQINRLYQMGMSKKAVKKAIKEALDLSNKEIKKLYHDALYNEYIRNQSLYKEKGAKWIAFDKNDELQTMIAAVEEQTTREMKNITQSLGFAIRGPDRKIIQSPIKDFYQNTLDDAMMDLASGAFDYNTVLKRTIQTMTASGLRTIDYDSGWSNRVDVAARRAVMTGFNQLQAKMNEQVAKALKTDYFEVSWHGGARPDHQKWQGRVYSRKQLETVCGLGSVTGLCGANCYHSYNAFIPGVSVRTYTDEQLEQMNAEENRPKKYNGREYTTYEALQHQRKMETLMRKQRQDINLLQEGGSEEDDVLAAKGRYRSTMAQYADFSYKMGLPQQKERIYMDGLGRLISGKEREPEPYNAKSISQKSTKAAENWAKSHLGVAKTNYTHQNTDVVNAINRSLQRIYREYPDLTGFLQEIEVTDKISSVAQAGIGITRTGEIRTRLRLSSQYFGDLKEVEKLIDQQVQNGNWTPKRGVHGILQHEMTHVLEYQRTLQKYGGDTRKAMEAIKQCEYAKKITDQAFSSCNIEKTTDIIRKRVGDYATKDDSELLAELVSSTKAGKLEETVRKLLREEGI